MNVADSPSPAPAAAAPEPIRRLASIALVLASALVVPCAQAQEEFLAGQQVELIAGFSEGSPANLLFREFAAALGRQPPDTQVIYRQNPGGTDALSTAMLAESAPDGLTIGVLDLNSLLVGVEGTVEYGIDDFTVIGALAQDVDVMFASADSGIDSAHDLIGRREPTFLAVRSTASGAYFRALMANALLGTQIRPVTGYDSGARDLAFRMGESPLAIPGLSASAQFLDEGIGVPLFKYADAEVPAMYGNPPPLSALDPDPRFAWLINYFNTASITQVVGAPKDTPPERIAVWRTVFAAAAADPAFAAEASKVIVLAPTTGDEIVEALDQLVSGVQSLSEDFARALACGKQLAETGENCT